jgi:hypothetical protein
MADTKTNRTSPKSLYDYKDIDLSEAEKQYHNDVLPLLRQMRDNRDKARKEWNDMRYPAWLNMCRETQLAYLPPKTNDDDIQLNSGLSRQKISTEVDVVLTQNFEARAKAFDSDDVFIDNLGDVLSDLKLKADQLEQWMDNRRTVYEGMSTYGSYYTLQLTKFVTDVKKTKVPIKDFGKIDIEWNETPKKSKPTFLTVSLESSMVLFPDMREPDIQKQPVVAIARIITDADARSRYGSFDRWKNVPTRQAMNDTNELSSIMTAYKSDYSVSQVLAEGEVEEVIFMRSVPYGNELMIYLNGIPMLPVMVKSKKDTKTGRFDVSGFPLTSWSTSGKYPIVKWDKVRIPNFAIARGTPGDSQFDQETLDTWIKLVFEKALRSIKPPMGNRSGIRITSDMIKSGKIVSQIRKDDIFSILPPELVQGVSNGEFSFYEMMKKELDEKTSTREFAGLGGKTQTATEFTENRKSQLLRFSALIDGVIRGEKDRADLIVKNQVIPFWCKDEYARNPADTEKLNKAKKVVKSKSEEDSEEEKPVKSPFRTVTVNKEDGAEKSANIINIGESDETSNDLYKREKEEEKEGRKNKYINFNPEMYDFMNTLIYWDVKPSERDNDTLELLQFKQNIMDGINLFGIQPATNEKLKKRWSMMTKEDYDTWFGGEDALALQEALGGVGGSTPNAGGLNPDSMTPPAAQNASAQANSGIGV